jgi:hypothetical protein
LWPQDAKRDEGVEQKMLADAVPLTCADSPVKAGVRGGGIEVKIV